MLKDEAVNASRSNAHRLTCRRTPHHTSSVGLASFFTTTTTLAKEVEEWLEKMQRSRARSTDDVSATSKRCLEFMGVSVV
jgi:hypothetical protein